MPKLDQCHEQIVHALEKAGWTVSPNPYVLRVENRRLYIDMFAQMSEPEQPKRIIIIEAKCFSDFRDELNELYTALGQYLTYLGLLEQAGVTDDLYLAIPTHAYSGVFRQFATPVTSKIQIKMIVVDWKQRRLNNGWNDTGSNPRKPRRDYTKRSRKICRLFATGKNVCPY